MKKEMFIHSVPTSRLIMINSTPAILEGILKGGNILQDILDVNVPDQWTEFGDGICLKAPLITARYY